MRSAWVMPVVAAVSILVPGCGDGDDEPGIVNHASTFCEEQGGRVEIERDVGGNERGICVLPDGTRVDEWEHYREHGGG